MGGVCLGDENRLPILVKARDWNFFMLPVIRKPTGECCLTPKDLPLENVTWQVLMDEKWELEEHTLCGHRSKGIAILNRKGRNSRFAQKKNDAAFNEDARVQLRNLKTQQHF